MTETFYKVSGHTAEILPVQVEKSTDSCVWIRGRRNNRLSGYDSYFERYDDARNFLIARVEKSVAAYARNLQDAERRLEKVILLPNAKEMEKLRGHAD